MRIDGDAFLGIVYTEDEMVMWLTCNGSRGTYDFTIFGWRYLRMHTVRRNRG